MKVALYCPNKPLSHPNPSGDLTIAGDLRASLVARGHVCEEIAAFRSRWFWKSPHGRAGAFAALLRAFRNTRAFRPHLWLTYHSYYKAPDVLGPVICRLFSIPYAIFEASYGTRYRRDPATRPGYYLNRFALSSCRQVFVNTTNDVEALLRVLPPDRIACIRPGIDPGEFQKDEDAGKAVRMRLGISPGELLIVTAARFRAGVKFESLEYLFHALAILHRRQLPFRLLVVGDGPMDASVRALAEALLPGRAVFAGRVPRRLMAHYYSAGDLFVFPGIGESLGMVFLEAQSCGLPVVALDACGVPQVVLSGETGLLVPRDGGDAMASAVERLLADGALRSRFGAGAAGFVRSERNATVNYSHFIRILEEIVADGAPILGVPRVSPEKMPPPQLPHRHNR
ncbi:MAG: glycosyltransferase family 4 protein [Syntrophobacteraceae bacterium]|nr:glycosyltransferase family 4 protein [Desulfobacteraceae bacterium]